MKCISYSRCRAQALLVASVAVSACSDASSTTPPDAGVNQQAPQERTIRFEARVGSDVFTCASPAMDMGTTAAMVEPLDFRVYIHDVHLVRADGSETPFTLKQDGVWQYQNLALLDFEDKTGTCVNGTSETNKVVVGAVPEGTYTGIKFKIGVPFALNHADVATAPSPLNLSGMFWNWNGGYKFVRIDGRVMGATHDADAGASEDAGGHNHGGEASAFNIHLGSTECTGDATKGGTVSACAKPNRGEVFLTGFDPLTATILVDYKALVADSNLKMEQGGAPGCMSGATDPECAPLFTRLGVRPATGEPNASSQSLFRIQ